MKRSAVAFITAGLILGGTGVVEILGTDTASSAPVTDRTVSVVAPARVSDSVTTDTRITDIGHRYATRSGTESAGQ
ncbi:hypothetical protein [Nocardia sp. NBC_01329]|uniref:hypothetical protein n=1 Tax=Nocardia sp. NBC_01329 TaxID=2903594 RepID=UPI002E106DBC|nr:hypothetical protein OG405_04885 [Nocardia sp. NBC_01329]